MGGISALNVFRRTQTAADVPFRIILTLYKGALRMGAGDMLRVGHGSTSTCSIKFSLESENLYHTTQSLRV